MRYNPKKSEGKRISQLLIGGKPVDLNRDYKLATTYYQGNWNEIFAGRDEKSVEACGKLRVAVADYIKRLGTVTPLMDGRIEMAYS